MPEAIPIGTVIMIVTSMVRQLPTQAVKTPAISGAGSAKDVRNSQLMRGIPVIDN
jgi:hypothetical protein